MPVPDLGSTIDRYLASLKAVLAPNINSNRKDDISGFTSEQIETNRLQFLRTQQLANQFMLNEGPQLQRDLKEYANRSQNWVSTLGPEVEVLLNRIPLRCVLGAGKGRKSKRLLLFLLPPTIVILLTQLGEKFA